MNPKQMMWCFCSVVQMLSSCPQSELENVNCILNDVESKSIKATKDCSAVESQLQDVQVCKKKTS